jgi:hypothetical protein
MYHHLVFGETYTVVVLLERVPALPIARMTDRNGL